MHSSSTPYSQTVSFSSSIFSLAWERGGENQEETSWLIFEGLNTVEKSSMHTLIEIDYQGQNYLC